MMFFADIDVTVAALSLHQGGASCADGERLDEVDYLNSLCTSSDNGGKNLLCKELILLKYI